MKPKTDLVIGHAVGFSWKDIEPFAVSLYRCGFTGKKVLFVKNLADDVMQKLIDLGFELIDISEDPGNDFLFGAMRHIHVHYYLQHHKDEFRYVFFTDTRDLIFQKNPSEWMENNLNDRHHLVASPEYIKVKDQPWNWAHIKTEFNELSKWIMNKTVLCGGFISGRAEYVSNLCLAVYLMARPLASTYHGVDQPVLNYVLYQKPYEDITHFPAPCEKFVINCQVAYSELDRHYHTYWIPPRTDEFVVVHQYDRIPELAKEIRERYTLES